MLFDSLSRETNFIIIAIVIVIFIVLLVNLVRLRERVYQIEDVVVHDVDSMLGVGGRRDEEYMKMLERSYGNLAPSLFTSNKLAKKYIPEARNHNPLRNSGNPLGHHNANFEDIYQPVGSINNMKSGASNGLPGEIVSTYAHTVDRQSHISGAQDGLGFNAGLDHQETPDRNVVMHRVTDHPGAT